MDIEIQESRSDPSIIETNAKTKSILEKVSQQLGVPPMDIFPTMGYRSEKKKKKCSVRKVSFESNYKMHS